MGDRDIEISDRSSDADIAELRAACNEYNFVTTGYRDGRSLVLPARRRRAHRGH